MDRSGSISQPTNLTGQVSLVNHIATFSGNYSSVYLGSLNGGYVALKVIKPVGQHDSVRRKLIREMTVWSTTNHPNIYPFYGYATGQSFGSFGALVSPWCYNGDASQYLGENGEGLIVAERVNLWRGVIDGVVYLHSLNPPIVHGDLKPGNILIDDSGNPRICDFGLSRIFSDETDTGMTTTSEHTGTARYLAPELVSSDTSVPPTFGSDVYALGSLGLEFIYLQKPYSNYPNNLRGQIFQALKRGLPPAATMPQKEWPSSRLWPLLLHCWTHNVPSRPPASTVRHMLRLASLSLPTSVLQRVISISAAQFKASLTMRHNLLRRFLLWSTYTSHLRNLCCVSRACWSTIMPILYGEIQLNLDGNPSSLSSLIYALNISGKEKELSRHVPNGYGEHTKMLTIGITEGEVDLEVFVDMIESLVQMMPNLRMLFLCNYNSDSSYFPESRGLRTLWLSGLGTSFVTNHAPKLLAVSCMQQLYLEKTHQSSNTHSTLTTLPRAILPNLTRIVIRKEPCGNALEAIATWGLPRLHTLEIKTPELYSDESSFLKFVRIHRHLQCLILTSSLQPVVLADILDACDNLRSIKIISHGFPSLDLLLPNPNMESFIIGFTPMEEPLQAILGDFKRFKVATRNSFPKLVDAKLQHASGQQIASFHAGEDHITVYADGNIHKMYDDGRVSPPLPGSSDEEDGMEDE